LEELGGIADMIRILSKSREGQDFLINLLPHKRAMLYFTQPSTRTFLSFMAACQILGITCNEVRDPSTSSETKGETRFDSIRMFSSYFDVIIMRSPIARLADRYTIVRSMSHEDLDHGSAVYLSLTGQYHSRRSSNPPPRPTDVPTMSGCCDAIGKCWATQCATGSRRYRRGPRGEP
jgi:hypothetical protein